MTGSRRRGGFVVLVGLSIVAAGTIVGGSRAVHDVEAKSCSSADLALAQAMSAGPVDTVTVRNLGPCGANGISVTVTPSGGPLPALSSVSVNPGTMSCSETATSLVCMLHSNVPASPSDVSAAATVSFPATQGAEYDAVTALLDPTQSEPGGQLGLNNDESWSSPLDPATGGKVSQGRAGANQIVQVNVPFVSGGQAPGASIQYATFACPKGFKPCLGTPVNTINPVTSTSNPTTLVFSYLASTVTVSIGQLTLYWSDNPGTTPWTAVPKCKGAVADPDPCYSSLAKVTIGGQTYYQFVVLSSFDNYWF